MGLKVGDRIVALNDDEDHGNWSDDFDLYPIGTLSEQYLNDPRNFLVIFDKYPNEKQWLYSGTRWCFEAVFDSPFLKALNETKD